MVDLSFIDEMIEQCEKFRDKIKEMQEQEKPKKVWTFSEDEKVILRNLPKKYKWVVRHADGELALFDIKPTKVDYYWKDIEKEKALIFCFGRVFKEYNHLFQTIQCEDDEPCEFRKFLGE